MDKIVKTFINKYIDLSKVVSISDARFIDRMGSGGYFVGFEIEVQLLEKPIIYTRKFDYSEEGWDGKQHLVIMTDGSKIPGRHLFSVSKKEESKILAVKNLQNQIDELVEQWKKIANEN